MRGAATAAGSKPCAILLFLPVLAACIWGAQGGGGACQPQRCAPPARYLPTWSRKQHFYTHDPTTRRQQLLVPHQSAHQWHLIVNTSINMPSNRRTETLDLNVPRNRAALEALLAAEDDEDDGPKKRQLKPKKNKRRTPAEEKRPIFFKLKDDTPAPGTPSAAANVPDASLAHMQDMFAGSCDPEVVADLWASLGGSFDAALEALLGMGLDAGRPAAPPSAGPQAGASSSVTGAHAAAPSSSLAAAEQLPCYWDLLPDDLRTAVLASLPLRDVARASTVCRGFAARAAGMQAAVRHLVIPGGKSPCSVRLVAVPSQAGCCA